MTPVLSAPQPFLDDIFSPRGRALRAGLLALVLLLHAAGLQWLAGGAGTLPAPIRAADDGRLSVRLIPLLRPDAPAPPAPRKPPPDGAPAAATRRPVLALPPAPGMSARSAAPAEDGTPPLSPAPEAPGPAPAAEPPLLDLRLPPSRAGGAGLPPRHAALDDPRANSRATAGERFAGQVAGPERLQEEATASGRRFRQGTRCWETRPARAAGLDAYNESTRPTPQQVEDCR